MESRANPGPGSQSDSRSPDAERESDAEETGARAPTRSPTDESSGQTQTKRRQFNRRLQTPTVLVLDGSVRTDLYEMWLGELYSVRTATSLSEALGKIDERVAAAVVRNEIGEEAKAEIETRLAAAAPSCKVVLTTSGHGEVAFPGMDYDECLAEPITKEELRSTVGRLLARSRYDAALRQYYRCSVDAANLEVQHTVADLEDHEEYAQLQDRIDMLTNLMDTLLERFDEDDLNSVLDGVRPKPTVAQAGQQESAIEEKHRPPSCSNCKLDWGVYHDSQLKEGYKRLGSFVWECARCGTVRSIPNPNHRRVARRR